MVIKLNKKSWGYNGHFKTDRWIEIGKGLVCKQSCYGSTDNSIDLEQYIFKNIEPDETVKIPNTGDGSDFIVECFVQTDEGDTIKHKVLDFNSNTADLIEYDPRYTVIDDDGIKPRTSVRLKLEKEQLTDDIVMYTSEPIPALLLDSIDNLQGWEILELIGKKRGFLIKGGEIDYERTAVMLCDEFRGGRLGEITLELP